MAYVQNIGTIILRFGIPEADIVTNTNIPQILFNAKKAACSLVVHASMSTFIYYIRNRYTLCTRR